jgi:hypothetical protein
MTLLRFPHAVLCALCTCAFGGGMVAAAGAQSGGTEAGETLLSAAPALSGTPTTFTGTLGVAAAGRVVAIQGLGPRRVWVTLARARADADGRFSARWTSRVAGRWQVRAIALGGTAAGGLAEPPTGTVTVYRGAGATWYDLSGSRTSCGVRLRKSTMGVAHRTLPCGTLVEITWGGKVVTVPVIDRGPFGRGLHYDLTYAAAKKLGFLEAGRVRVGVLPQPRGRTVPPLRAFAPLPQLGDVAG